MMQQAEALTLFAGACCWKCRAGKGGGVSRLNIFQPANELYRTNSVKSGETLYGLSK